MKNPKKPDRKNPVVPATQPVNGTLKDDYLDNVEVQRIFHLSARTALRWRKDGLVHSKIGRKIFYHRKSIEAFLDRYRHGGTPEQA